MKIMMIRTCTKYHHLRAVEDDVELVMVESPAFGKEGLEDLSRLDR